MNYLLTLIVVALLLIAGCSKSPDSASPYGVSGYALEAKRYDVAGRAAETPRRFIAVRHQLVIETLEADLPKAWESAAQFCQTLRCEILSSSINNKTEESSPSGSLSLRVAPEDLSKLFDHLGKAGSVLQHATEAEDKTAVVIDVEAKLKNLTEFRNRLRTMLATRPASLKDVIEVERELSKVQADLDSFTTRRRVLANETEKVAVQIEFRSRRSIAGTGSFAPIVRAWREAGAVLSVSIAYLLTFIVAVVPWLVLLVPACWISVKLLRRLFRKRSASAESVRSL